MANSLPTLQTYLVGERGIELFVPLAQCPRMLPRPRALELHDGEWFVRAGARDAAQANAKAAAVLAVLLTVVVLVLA